MANYNEGPRKTRCVSLHKREKRTMAKTAQLHWVPVLGDFDVSRDAITFKGKRVPPLAVADRTTTDATDQASVGMLLSNGRISDGIVRAEIEFDKVTDDTGCELAIQYRTNPLHFLVAGLGGPVGAMYAIREYRGDAIREFGGDQPAYQGRWHTHTSGGVRSGLQPKRKYQVVLGCLGGYVNLNVDGVEVAESGVTLPHNRPKQVGLFCRADHKITIRKYDLDADQPRAFVIMQFGGDYDELYSDVVKQVADDYEIIRADEVRGPGLIVSDIVQQISSAHLIIADITPTNANVYFEVGYAMALQKPIIFLARKGTTLPFDVAGFRVLFYENTIGGKGRLEDALRYHLEAIRNFSA